MKNTIRIAVAAVAVVAACMASARTMTMKVNRPYDLIESFDFTFDNVGVAITNSLWVAYGTSDGGSGSYSNWGSVRFVSLVPGDVTALDGVLPPDGWDDEVSHLRFFLTSGNGIIGADSLEYIEATQTSGNQWIKTAFVPTGDSCVEMDFAFSSQTPPSSTFNMFCARGAGNVDTFTLFWFGGESKWRWDYSTNQQKKSDVDTSLGDACHHLKVYYKGVEIDGDMRGNTTYAKSAFDSAGRPMTLFASNTSGDSPGNYGSWKLYSFKAWTNGDDDATLALDLVPCRKSDGTVCLYNRVDGEFLTNQGSGSFAAGTLIATAGPEVVDSVTDLVETSRIPPSTEHVDSAFHHMSHCVRSLGDVNGNGVVDAAEVVDLTTWSAASRTTIDSVSVCGDGRQICHTNIEYVAAVPAHQTRQSKGIYFPQPVTTDGVGQLLGVVQTLRIDNAACLGLTNAFHIHFRWDGPVQTNYAAQCTLMRYGYSSSNPYSGMRVYVETSGNSWSNGYLRFQWLYNGADAAKTFSITAGTWYDLIVSRRYKIFAGDNSQYIDIDLLYPRDYIDNDEEVVWEEGHIQTRHDGAHAYARSTKTDIIFGGDETVTEPTAITSGTDAAARSFRGVIDAYECWDDYAPPRDTLTQLREIVSGYHGAIAAIGNVNGRADEFSDEAPAAVFDCDTMEWRQFRKTLTAANPSVKFKVNLGTDVFVKNWPQVLSLTPIFSDDSPRSCPVEIYVNDNLAQKGNLRSASGRALYIGAKYMKPDSDGYATFEIRRTGNLEGGVSLDAVALCGGGSFGRHNNSNTEFIHQKKASRHAIFGDSDAKHVRWAHNAGDSSYCYYAFYLPADSIGRETYNGLLAVTSDTTARGNVYVNGTAVLDMAAQAASHPDYTFDIPDNLLKPGLNEIFVNGNGASSTDWLKFDCVQLRAEGEDFGKTGLLIFVR